MDYFVRKVQKQNNQHLVNIPFGVMKSLGLKKGDLVYFIVEGEAVFFGKWDPTTTIAPAEADATERG